MRREKWTKAGVRHKTPKWYWVRWSRETEVQPVQLSRRMDHDLDAQMMVRGYERWSEPIKEPK